MCGRFTLFTDYALLLDRFNIGEAAVGEDEYEPNYNIAPSQPILAIINDGKQNRLGTLRWGLIPGWAKDEKIGYKMINARAETAAEKPSFRTAFRKRRCLIPADSFYEWKRNGDVKTPMRIRLASGEPFAFAGLWESWKSPEGKTVHSCTILTTEPNELMADIHDRMPVILPKSAEAKWLDPDLQDAEELQAFLVPYTAAPLEAHEVSPLVNSPRNNGPELIEKQ